MFFGPTFGWPYPYPYPSGTPAPSAPSPVPPAPPQPATGALHLELQSGVDPQIYVDGYFVGLLSDASGGDLILDAGAHTIELREEGYDTLREQLRVPVDGVITYRAELTPLNRVDRPARGADLPGPRPEVPPAPTTIYLIPGCYVGNVPPRDAVLPAGCDPRDAVEFPPAR